MFCVDVSSTPLLTVACKDPAAKQSTEGVGTEKTHLETIQLRSRYSLDVSGVDRGVVPNTQNVLHPGRGTTHLSVYDLAIILKDLVLRCPGHINHAVETQGELARPRIGRAESPGQKPVIQLHVCPI